MLIPAPRQGPRCAGGFGGGRPLRAALAHQISHRHPAATARPAAPGCAASGVRERSSSMLLPWQDGGKGPPDRSRARATSALPVSKRAVRSRIALPNEILKRVDSKSGEVSERVDMRAFTRRGDATFVVRTRPRAGVGLAHWARTPHMRPSQ